MPDEQTYDHDEFDNFDNEDVLDASDSLEGNPGDDPLDRGTIAPDRWTSAMRYGSTAQEQEDGESLDQHLAEEVPDEALDYDDDDELPADLDEDDEAGDEDVDGLLLDDGPDPRAGRLVAEDEGAHTRSEPDLVASDTGIDGGAASAEEAAVHVVEDDDTDIRSGD
jgi:hypothetical protein